MTRVLRLSRLSPLLLLAAVALAVLAVFLVNHTPPAQAQTRTVWYATLTAGDAGSQDIGFDSAAAVGTLSDSIITYDGMDYDILGVFVDDTGELTFWFSADTPPNSLKSPPSAPALTLHVGNSQFALADATLTNSDTRLVWNNTGLSWSVGDTVRLRLTVKISEINPPLPTLTASVSPDPIVEGSDLWSATLTVQDLGTTAPAPANVGCDDSKAGVQCSIRLTERDFTFKGVDYTVKAISYNQRKVAADTTTFTVTTYEESLKLTLDKTIPESLQSCLTLHSGNARVRLAGDSLVGVGVDAELSDSNGVANSTVTVTEISGEAWGLNWSAGQTVKLRLPNVGCLTLTLSEAVDEETSMQIRFTGTASNERAPDADYGYSKLPVFAKGSTTASKPIEVIDDSRVEGCETITLDMTMWPGTYRAVHASYTVAIQDNDGGNPCVGGG